MRKILVGLPILAGVAALLFAIATVRSLTIAALVLIAVSFVLCIAWLIGDIFDYNDSGDS